MNVPGIAGIGTDLLRVDRVARIHARYGDRFVQRILGADEQRIHERRSLRDPHRGIRYLATRFAAKEAFSKAIGLGIHQPMMWSRVQILNRPGGAPEIHLAGPLASWYETRFGVAHVSVTDESDLVAAFVVIEALRQATPPEGGS